MSNSRHAVPIKTTRSVSLVRNRAANVQREKPNVTREQSQRKSERPSRQMKTSTNVGSLVNNTIDSKKFNFPSSGTLRIEKTRVWILFLVETRSEIS